MKKVLLDSIWEEEEDYDAERDREEFLISVMFSEVVSPIVSPASFDSNTMLMAHQQQVQQETAAEVSGSDENYQRICKFTLTRLYDLDDGISPCFCTSLMIRVMNIVPESGLC